MAESQLTDRVETSGGSPGFGLPARRSGQVLWRRRPAPPVEDRPADVSAVFD